MIVATNVDKGERKNKRGEREVKEDERAERTTLCYATLHNNESRKMKEQRELPRPRSNQQNY